MISAEGRKPHTRNPSRGDSLGGGRRHLLPSLCRRSPRAHHLNLHISAMLKAFLKFKAEKQAEVEWRQESLFSEGFATPSRMNSRERSPGIEYVSWAEVRKGNRRGGQGWAGGLAGVLGPRLWFQWHAVSGGQPQVRYQSQLSVGETGRRCHRLLLHAAVLRHCPCRPCCCRLQVQSFLQMAEQALKVRTATNEALSKELKEAKSEKCQVRLHPRLCRRRWQWQLRLGGVPL